MQSTRRKASMYTVENTDTFETIQVHALSSLEALTFAEEELGWVNTEAYR